MGRLGEGGPLGYRDRAGGGGRAGRGYDKKGIGR